MSRPKRYTSTAAALVLVIALTSALLTGGAAAGAPQVPSSQVPHYDHIFTVIEENHGFEDIIGNPAAPTLNKLAQNYGLATQY